jgi:hypothetical protein
VVELEERNEDWRMELGSNYEKLIALINYIGSLDVHFFKQSLNLEVHLFKYGGSTSEEHVYFCGVERAIL